MRLRPRPPQSYAERTHASPLRIVRYAHRRRFEAVISLALQRSPKVVLDYGAGDGEMMLRLLSDSRCPSDLRAIVYEPNTDGLVGQLKGRSDRAPTERLELVSSRDEVAEHSCDVITCAGVLEHVCLSERFEFYDFARRTLRDGGRVVIDVPIEIGPAVLIKTVTRRVFKSYDKEYSLGGSIAVAAGIPVFDPKRYDPVERGYFVSHFGFDYRLLRKEMQAQGFDIERTVASPVSWLPAALANQEAIFVASVANGFGSTTADGA